MKFTNYRHPPRFNGRLVIFSEKAMKKVAKTWVERVIEWNPCNPWRKPDLEPSFFMRGKHLVCHPDLKNEVKRIRLSDESLT